MIQLWKGYHESTLPELIRGAWESTAGNPSTLILCPPLLGKKTEDFNFLPCLPDRKITALGDWTQEERNSLAKVDETSRAGNFLSRWEETPVLGVFTSGTVGKPRLVLYSRKNIEASLHAILSVFERDRIDAIFSYPQPFHTFGLVLGYLQSLITEKPLIAPSGRYTSEFHSAWLKAAGQYPGMLTLGTPTHFQDLVKFVSQLPSPPPFTYSAVVGGAATPRALWLALRDRVKISAPSIGYGCTEASPGLTHLPPGMEPEQDGEIGGALPETELVILPGSGIEFHGPQTCLATIQEGKIHFPTRVLILDRLREERPGRFIFEGRYDLVFNRGGVKFSLEEIEGHLKSSFPGTAFLCVATKDERLGEDLGILFCAEGTFSTVTDDSPVLPILPEVAEIAESLSRRFHARFDPRRILHVEILPTNSAAKPDRAIAAGHFR